MPRDHPFFEDLLQEARIAVYLAKDQLDPTQPDAKQKFFLRTAAQWKITKAWRSWLSVSSLVSNKSLRKGRAVFGKVVPMQEYVYDTISDGQPSVESVVSDKERLEKVLEALEESVKTEEEHQVIKALLNNVDSRTLGRQIGKSHQGAINIQKRLLKKVRKKLERNKSG